VVADVAVDSGYSVLGMVDDRAKVPRLEITFPFLGGRDWLLSQGRDEFFCALGVGDNLARKAIARFLLAEGFVLATLISRFAVISPFAKLGSGTVVMPCAAVNCSTAIGDGVIVNTGAVVEHDCKVRDYTHLAPNSTLGGGVEVGESSLVGIGATVMPYLRVGSHSIVGAGSLVSRAIPDYATAVGVPARIMRRAAQPPREDNQEIDR